MTLTFHWYVVGKYDVYTALWQRNNRHNVSVPMMMPLELRLNTSNCVSKSGQRKRSLLILARTRLMLEVNCMHAFRLILKRILLILLVLCWIYFIINEWEYTNSKKVSIQWLLYRQYQSFQPSELLGCMYDNHRRNYLMIRELRFHKFVSLFRSLDIWNGLINTNFETFESKWKFKILTFSVDF